MSTILYFRLMQACIDLTFDYVHSRKQFDTKIGEFQLIQVCLRLQIMLNINIS